MVPLYVPHFKIWGIDVNCIKKSVHVPGPRA
jgi:hypothetical protein